ncbi:Uncharacterized protein APZ42_028931 [Daphnia magna]|uniref:Uncharacterized protein n=1 Tax=Daphnia magna TaxID=35525 RepID=A0A164Q2J9_9CRUS|nr:Uncharacterized protein APZ42_028931 [Daphnia magna]
MQFPLVSSYLEEDSRPEAFFGVQQKRPNPIRDFVFRRLCLAYLPAEKIPFVLDGLRDSAPQELERLLEYMDKNWIHGRFLTPENWSSFNLLLRTNNDCEVLHNEWNKLAGGPYLPFYKMTMVVQQLCDDVTLTLKLLSHKKIMAHRKKETSMKNSILFTLWSCYQATELYSNQLLEEIVLELLRFFPLCSF